MKTRIKISIHGVVQGVGFRPFIYRLAQQFSLMGMVSNTPQGVIIEAEGVKENVEEFLLHIDIKKPKMSSIYGMEFSYLDCVGYNDFQIEESIKSDLTTTIISPDIAVCSDCLYEMNDPENRRYQYPFINCTNCGPRFTIIESLPYDRPNTSMSSFSMCQDCREEYDNPEDRRYHAQPIACPNCGPQVELVDLRSVKIIEGKDVIKLAVDKLNNGSILALKGIGGYQLIVDATNIKAVEKLRKRKNRDEKPFAMMMDSIEMVKECCEINKMEERTLLSPESPIVLLKRRKKDKSDIVKSVAPDNPYLGIMLPYSPLHHLILNKIEKPIIATSGNISQEPMCINEKEAYRRLGNIADYFLNHNREIVRQVDDSIVRIFNGREMILRRARGYAPLPFGFKNGKNSNSIISVGGHLKNNISLSVGNQIFVSQHIGDLASEQSYSLFLNTLKDFKSLYKIEDPEYACDIHPGYISTNYAKSMQKRVIGVQHHFAHIASCRAENEIKDTTLGISWDGTGYGLDSTIWGGEFFVSDNRSFSHVAQLRQFRLPGGEKAVQEGRRSALGLLFEIYGWDLFDNSELLGRLKFEKKELDILESMLENKINSPLTSSMGRLFDAVSSILEISHYSNFEGQSAMQLEFDADPNEGLSYKFGMELTDKIIVDWEIIIKSILQDIENNIPISRISSKFHNTLASIILRVAYLFGINKVVLSGGCFQNVYLLKVAIQLLEENNFKVYTHQRIPPNDGGISLGQIAGKDVHLKKYDFTKLKLVENESVYF